MPGGYLHVIYLRLVASITYIYRPALFPPLFSAPSLFALDLSLVVHAYSILYILCTIAYFNITTYEAYTSLRFVGICVGSENTNVKEFASGTLNPFLINKPIATFFDFDKNARFYRSNISRCVCVAFPSG